MAFPSFKPTPEHRRLVEAMVAYGIPEEAISKVIGIAPKTLRKHFTSEIATAQPRANAKVAEFLFKRATGQAGTEKTNVTAAIFWLKCRARWRDSLKHEIVGEDGGPIELVTRIERVIVEGNGNGNGNGGTHA